MSRARKESRIGGAALAAMVSALVPAGALKPAEAAQLPQEQLTIDQRVDRLREAFRRAAPIAGHNGEQMLAQWWGNFPNFPNFFRNMWPNFWRNF